MPVFASGPEMTLSFLTLQVRKQKKTFPAVSPRQDQVEDPAANHRDNPTPLGNPLIKHRKREEMFPQSKP